MLLSQQVVHVIDLDNKMDYACTAVLRVSTLKDKQKEAIHNCVRGHDDCFVILPTGVRENVVLCLAAFRVRDRLSSKETSIVVCVSPLVSLSPEALLRRHNH